MALSSVNIYKHGGEWKFEDEKGLHDLVKEEFSKYNSDLNEVCVYLMGGSNKHYGVTSVKSTYYIFLNALPSDSEIKTEDVEVNLLNGEDYVLKKYKEPSHKVQEVKNAHGQIIAYVSKTHNEVYVPFKLNEFSGEELEKIIIQLLKEINKVLFEKYELRNSWTLESNRERLMEEIKEHHTINIEREIEKLKRDIADRQHRIDGYRRTMKEAYDNIALDNRKILQIESQSKDNGEKFAEQLDLIAEYPGVTKIEIEGKKIKISVKDVYAYAKVSGDTRRYYIGDMRMEVNMKDSDVRFHNMNNPRKGYWTEKDAHPHVDGSNGYPCLGNVSATIAELVSSKEVYALFLTLLDYLQNANTDDVAGRTVTSWDEVDEQGNIVSNPAKIKINECEHCGEEVDDTVRVYTSHYGEGAVDEGRNWCENCVDEDAVYNDYVEEYVAYGVHEEVQEYLEGDE